MSLCKGMTDGEETSCAAIPMDGSRTGRGYGQTMVQDRLLCDDTYLHWVSRYFA